MKPLHYKEDIYLQMCIVKKCSSFSIKLKMKAIIFVKLQSKSLSKDLLLKL